jgi:glucose/mannose-6-phosphate isomerase
MLHPLDKSNMHGSVTLFAEQCIAAWELTRQLQLPENYRTAKKILVCSMGGSGLGTHVIEALFAQQLRVPVLRVNHYNLPAYVDEETLVILSSYSGTTEETLACYQAVQSKTKLLLSITTGGDLLTWSKQDSIPYITFDPSEFNPSGQPRSAIGFSVVVQLGIFERLGFIAIGDEEMRTAIAHAKSLSTDVENNPAHPIRQIVTDAKDHGILLFVGPLLTGAAHAMSNQINETGKNFCTYFELPELNHHLLEGLANPTNVTAKLKVIQLESSLYHERTQRRFDVTAEILEKLGMPHVRHVLTGSTPLAAALETLQTGGYVSYLLGLQNGEDPSPVPWVTYLKQRLTA